MRLTRIERAVVKMKFGGRCAYCGDPLGDNWHADHFEPVVRKTRWEDGVGFVPTGEMHLPKNDRIENLMPACAPCNIDKGAYSLEGWRAKLQGAVGVLNRNNATYRHAKRFGLVLETVAPIKFYFEQEVQKTEG